MSESEALRLCQELETLEAKWPEAFEGAARNNAHLNLTCLDEIAHHQALGDAMEDLLGPNLLNYGTALLIKEPHVGITAWVALSPATYESGCMKMIPGSHAEIRPHDDTYGA